jgi:hypothetical protein
MRAAYHRLQYKKEKAGEERVRERERRDEGCAPDQSRDR